MADSSLSEVEKKVIQLETKFEILTENLTNAILRLEKKLDELSQNYVTKDVLDGKLELRDKEIQSLKEKMKENADEKKHHKQIIPSWVNTSITILSVVVAMAMYLKK